MLTPYIEEIRFNPNDPNWTAVGARFGHDFACTIQFRNKRILDKTDAANAVIARIKAIAGGFPDTIRSNIPAPVKDYYYQGR